MQRFFQYLSTILLGLSVIILFGFEFQLAGWIILLLGALTLFKISNEHSSSTNEGFSKDLLLLYGSIAILSITPINPDISWSHIFIMGLGIFTVVAFPYYVSRFIYKNRAVTFNFGFKRGWGKLEVTYLAVSIFLAYLILPFYLKNTGAYTNWVFEPTFNSIARIFIGINVVGVWDELFFINVTYGILKRHLSFAWANIIQAIMFSTILYHFGFIQWGFAMIFVFALLQGYIYRKTRSLLYVIIVHLSVDFILFLALLNAHYPNWVPIFLN